MKNLVLFVTLVILPRLSHAACLIHNYRDQVVGSVDGVVVNTSGQIVGYSEDGRAYAIKTKLGLTWKSLAAKTLDNFIWDANHNRVAFVNEENNGEVRRIIVYSTRAPIGYGDASCSMADLAAGYMFLLNGNN